MPVAANSVITRDSHQGFTVVRAANDQVAVEVIPALGAKLCSLRSLATGREWLWRPPGPPRLFASQVGAAFATGTLIGADECLPTIAACNVAGRGLPDHGEAWSAAWELDRAALARGEILTRLRLPQSPLEFSRALRLRGSGVELDYTLRNLAAERQSFLWALHPLFNLQDGDRLQLPGGVSQVRVESARQPDAARGTVWDWPAPMPGIDLRALRLGGDQAYAKFFAGPLVEGWARITNDRIGDRLEIRWPVQELPFAGLWLTRGGWRGLHHFAVEPTNAACDSLADALSNPIPQLFVAPGEVRCWSVVLDFGPAPA